MTPFAAAQLLKTMAAEAAGAATAAEAKLAMHERQAEQTNQRPGWIDGARNRARSSRQAVEHHRARQQALEAGAQALAKTAAEAVG